MRAVPEPLKVEARVRAVTSDRRSRSQLRQLLAVPRGAETETPAAVELGIRALGGRRLAVRPGTSDLAVLLSTFVGLFQLPPREVAERDLRVIIDLGSNIGSTIAQLAAAFPNARIVGAEPDSENSALCRRNIAAWGHRCELIEAAVWSTDGPVSIRREAGHEDGVRVTESRRSPASGEPIVQGLTLNTLLADLGDPVVDYMKMDIEGAEREVLRRNSRWSSVNSIKVEVHRPYTVHECQADLRALGFATRLDKRHPACVEGSRNRQPAR